MPPRVVVAVPGGERHLRDVAAAFAEAGQLELYLSSWGFGRAQVEEIGRRLPAPVSTRVTRELKRRAVPDNVAAHAKRLGTLLELANVAVARAPVGPAVKVAAYRPTRLAFDRAVARTLPERANAIVGSQGSTTVTFDRAIELGMARVLDYPIAHYEFTERVLTEEARRQPDWAQTMLVTRYPRWLRERYRREIANADRIIMVSEHHRDNFAAAGIDPARTFIVPWYVNAELFTPPEREAPGRFRVAFLGELSQRKGLSYLIEAFRRAALPDAELLLIGRVFQSAGPWLGHVNVHHVPPMPNFLLPEVLRTCHALVMPSLVEGFPVSVLEGMACGLPAVISENLGSDIVEDGRNGFVVPIRDPEAIADRLRVLHDDAALRLRMREAARATAATFTAERHHAALRAGVGKLVSERESITG